MVATMLSRPFNSLEGWVTCFAGAEVPVFRCTIERLALLREREDELAPAEIGDAVREDPLMTLKLLQFAARRPSQRAMTDSETVTSSLLLMGVSPFFRNFETVACVEDWLGEDPELLAGLNDVVERAFRAANLAVSFAVLRADPDAEVIQEAALLREFAEMLLWCHAPTLARTMRRRQLAQPGLRSAAVQREVLNIELADLERGLMQAWHLPEFLADITDSRNAHLPRVRNVLVAVDIARHSQHGWDNPALPDDFKELGELLNIAPEHARDKAMALED